MSKFATTIKGLAKNRIVIFIAGMIVAILIGMVLQKTTESYESPEQLEAELNALLQEISKAPELQTMEGAESNPDVEVSDEQSADLQALQMVLCRERLKTCPCPKNLMTRVK